MLQRFAARAVADWSTRRPAEADIAALVADEADKAGQRPAGEIVGEVLALRQSQAEALRLAAEAVGTASEFQSPLPAPNGVPAMQRVQQMELPVHRPALRWPGRRALERLVYRRCRAQAGNALAGAFQTHARQLAEWRLRSLNDLRHAFTAQSEVSMALAGTTGGGGQMDADRAGLAGDIEALLQTAPSARGTA